MIDRMIEASLGDRLHRLARLLVTPVIFSWLRDCELRVTGHPLLEEQ